VAENLKAIIVEVTGGNVRNAHIYLREALGFFPKDSIGGSSLGEAAKPVRVRFIGEEIETDIDGSKFIFRDRGSTKRFFEHENVEEGDLVLIEREGPRLYSISKASKRAFKYHL
jgi:hypothetical protein